MKNQFVPYEIAIALKEFRFDDFKMFGWYVMEDDSEFGKSLHTIDDRLFRFLAGYCVKAPLWQQVIDYFRTKHNIVIELTRFEHRDTIVEWVYIIEKWDDNIITDYYDCEHFDTYEEAREAAILKAVEIIKNKKP